MTRTPEEMKRDARALAAEERNKIAVVKVDGELKKDEEKEVEEEKEEIEEKKEETKEEEIKVEADETKEDVEEKEEEIEKNEDEQKDLEKEKKEAKTDKEKERVQKRIDRLTAKNKTLEAEKDQLVKQLAAAKEGKETFTAEDMEARAKEIATAEVDQREFSNMCARLNKAANKLDKDFDDKIDEVTKEVGKIPSQMISVLDDLDNGAQILVYFADDVDEFERVKDLSITKMAIEITKLATKLGEKKLNLPSKAPAPIDPIKSAKKVDAVLTGKENMEDFVRKRNAQAAKRAEDRAKGLIR